MTTEVAEKLISLGLQRGDRVGVYSPNCIEWTVVQMACARADLILVNVNPAFVADELAYCLNKVQVKVLVMAD
jgi:acyl-CoA synthetase (AMP-forming)/AMP-acid ligase II